MTPLIFQDDFGEDAGFADAGFADARSRSGPMPLSEAPAEAAALDAADPMAEEGLVMADGSRSRRLRRRLPEPSDTKCHSP